MRNYDGFFYLLVSGMKERYQKPPILVREQISLLESRGLIIDNSEIAFKTLSCINYYHISAYCIPFEKKRHVFQKGVTFSRILQLYNFDNEIRTKVSVVLRDIEIFMRTIIANSLSINAKDPFVLSNRDIFRKEFNYEYWINNIEEEAKRSSETFINHYKVKYEGFPVLPIWMLVEIMSMGSLSRLYAGLIPKHQKPIAEKIKVHKCVLTTWLHTITYLRNICAHHARISNRKLAISPLIPNKDSRWRGLRSEYLYASVVILEYIVHVSNLDMTPIKELYSVIKIFLDKELWFAEKMGIPHDWDGDMYWKNGV